MSKKTSDCDVACRMVQDNGSTVDYVGVSDDIIQVSFRHILPTTIFKVIWYKDNVRWNDCLIYFVKHTDVCEAVNLLDEPFVFPESVEQVFFANDVWDRNWSFFKLIPIGFLNS
jgi:hypothetical protein